MKAGKAAFLCGPTAIGKSAVALELARVLDGEIISVDSMQVYCGLDIGTAKPSAAERSAIPHHLIDVVELTDSFDAAKFVALAKEAEAEIRARNHFPIYCGGTGLYFNALLHGLGEAPASDAKVRSELEGTPLSKLVAELKSSDPAAAEQIDLKNPRRVIRALEVIRLTGRPFSKQRAEWPKDATPVIGLDMDREALHVRINARVDKMFRNGLVAETHELISRGLRENRTASQALGYKQVIEHLDGARSLAETIELVKLRTRQFAKRQLTWFRGQLNCDWINVDADESAADIAARLVERFR